jgi:hypothetical protein
MSRPIYPFERSFEKATTLTSTLFITCNSFVIRLIEPQNDIFGRPHVQGGMLHGLFQYLNHDVAQSRDPRGAANNSLEVIPSILCDQLDHIFYESLLGESRRGGDGMDMLEGSNRFPILILCDAIQSLVQFLL